MSLLSSERGVWPGETLVHEVQADRSSVFSTYSENPLVRRINRRITIRNVRLCRST